jgi:hypothetical protein
MIRLYSVAGRVRGSSGIQNPNLKFWFLLIQSGWESPS